MESKKILPTDKRLNMDYPFLEFIKSQDVIKYHQALEAAEKELEEKELAFEESLLTVQGLHKEYKKELEKTKKLMDVSHKYITSLEEENRKLKLKLEEKDKEIEKLKEFKYDSEFHLKDYKSLSLEYGRLGGEFKKNIIDNILLRDKLLTEIDRLKEENERLSQLNQGLRIKNAKQQGL